MIANGGQVLFLRRLHNNRGLGLLETIVATAIMAVVIFGLSTFFVNMFRHEKQIKDRAEARELLEELNEVVMAENCGLDDLNSGGINITDWVDTTIYDLPKGVGNNFLQIKKDVAYGKLQVTETVIAAYFNKTNSELKYVPVNGDKATATIMKASIQVSGETSLNKNTVLRVPVFLTLASGKIVGCYKETSQDSIADFCVNNLGGEYLDESQKCKLPCPPGMIENGGECKVPVGSGFICDSKDSCNADSKYIL